MTEKTVLELFKKEKALLSGHFLLSSGLHSPNYLQCAILLEKPWIAEGLCRSLAARLRGTKIDVVIGPALGGILVSYEMGRALKKRSIFAERVEGKFALRRGFSLAKNERALVVEDVVTTGKSTNEVISLVKEHGARLAAVAAIVDRSEGKVDFEKKLHSLLKITIPTYPAEGCPLCRMGKVPLVKPGSREMKVAS